MNITVDPVNDKPIANNQNVATPEDQAKEITLTGSDVDQDDLSFTLLADPQNGTISDFDASQGTLTYTPDINYVGTNAFSFKVNDGNLDSDPATVNITITNVNDKPLANQQKVSTKEDTPQEVTLKGSDPEGDPLTFIIVNNPTQGKINDLNSNTGTLTYVPNNNYNGNDAFTFKVNDGKLDSDPAIVSISISPVNDKPSANSQNLSISEDQQVDITLSGNDPDQDVLTFALLSQPANGTISEFSPSTGQLTYIPDNNYSGSDSFTFKVNDGKLDSNPAAISIGINAVNDPPVARRQSVTTDEDTPVGITLRGRDIEGADLTYKLNSQPSHGTISNLNAVTGTLTYTPDKGYYGNDAFTFVANDGELDSKPAEVNLTVNFVNFPPTANPLTANTKMPNPVNISLSATDPDQDNLTYIITQNPGKGTISNFNAIQGTLTYTPASSGTDVFWYKVNDGTVDSSPVKVTLNIAKGSVVFNFSNLTQTFNGQPRSVSITTNPQVSNINVTYNDKSTVPTDAGTYTVKAVVEDPDYEGSETRTLTVRKATASIQLSGLNQTYDGTLKSATFTTVPANLKVKLNYTPSQPINVGEYVVSANIDEKNYLGSVSGTLKIVPANVNITLSNLNQTYDGTTKSVGVSTNPPGIATVVTYNNSSNLPVNAGQYNVNVRVTNPNYVGTKSGLLVIEKQNANINLSQLVQTFDNDPKPISYSTEPNNLNVVVKYNGNATAPTAAGEYEVEANIVEPNYKGTKKATLTIQKSSNATVNISNLEQIYDGSAKKVSISTQPANLKVNVTYDGASTLPKNAGSYNVVAIINDNNYSGATEETLVINKAQASINLSDLKQTFDGNPKGISYTTNPAGLNVDLRYNNSVNEPSDAGTYTVKATINETNYQGTVQESFIIEKAAASINLFNINQTYTGNPINVEYITSPPDLEVNIAYDNNKDFLPVDAGTYQVNATIISPNYQGSTSRTLTIQKANAAILLSNLEHDYDGTAKSANYITNPPELEVNLTYNGSEDLPVTAGEYLVEANIVDINYTGSNTGTMIINPIPATVTLSNMTQTYTGDPKKADYQTDPPGLLANLTYDSELTLPTEVGSYEVEATINDQNYFGTTSGILEIIEVNIDENDPPSFTSSPLRQIEEGKEYIYQIETSDPDQGDTRSINSVNPLPNWLSLTDNGDGSGLLTGLPDESDVGSYSIQLKVTDQADSFKVQIFNIVVIDVNYEPVITSEPTTSAIAGNPYQYNVLAEDQDQRDVLTFSAINKPDWLNLTDNQDGTALLAGTPGEGNTGNFEVVLLVEDGKGGKDQQQFIIQVNQLPVVSDFEKSLSEDEVLSFTSDDFSTKFSDTDGNPLAQVKVTQLPSSGLLMLNSTVIKVDDEIEANQLSSLKYVPDQNFFGADQFGWNASDGIGYATNPALVQITVIGSNDAPVLDNLENTPVLYTAVKDVNKVISDQLTVNDPDGDNIVSAQISFSPNSFYPNEDLLNFENTANIKGTYDPDAGILLLQGEDTPENYQAALRSVRYQNIGANPTFQNRIINFYVNDGLEVSNIVKREINLGNIEVEIPTGITPNGDNVNDTWIIENIQAFPDCLVKVFTRTGNVIFESVGYSFPWDGTYQNQFLPAGTYYYIINLNKSDESGRGRLQGTITIIR
ncbi:MAG: MBG domain-containing protein [Candidatus Cyclobacteriaceae bacterium M3_2C_046]